MLPLLGDVSLWVTSGLFIRSWKCLWPGRPRQNQSCFICTPLVRGVWQLCVCTPAPLPVCLLRRELCTSISFTAAPPRPCRRHSKHLLICWRKKLCYPRGFNSGLINYPIGWSRWPLRLSLPPHTEPAPALSTSGNRSAVLTSPLTLLSKREILVIRIFPVCPLLWPQRNLSYLLCHHSFTSGAVLWRGLVPCLRGKRWDWG